MLFFGLKPDNSFMGQPVNASTVTVLPVAGQAQDASVDLSPADVMIPGHAGADTGCCERRQDKPIVVEMI